LRHPNNVSDYILLGLQEAVSFCIEHWSGLLIAVGLVSSVGGCTILSAKEELRKQEVAKKIERIVESKNPNIDFEISGTYNTGNTTEGIETAQSMKTALGNDYLIGEFASVNKKEGTIEKGYFLYSLQKDEKGKETSEPDKVMFITDVMKAGISVIR